MLRWVKIGRSFMMRLCSTSSRFKRCRRERSLSLWSRWGYAPVPYTLPLKDAKIASSVVTICFYLTSEGKYGLHTASQPVHIIRRMTNLFYRYVSVKRTSCCRNCTSCMDISSTGRIGNRWKVNNDSGQGADFGISFLCFILQLMFFFNPLITLCFLPLAFFLSIFPIVLQLLAFLQGLFTFYHEGYELASEFEPYKQQLQFNLQNVSMNIDLKSYKLRH